MARDQHIDATLLALFLRSGAYRDYAERFLATEQRDEIDVEACVGQLRDWGLLHD